MLVPPSPDPRFQETVTAPPAPAIARRLGQYDLEEPLGRGGMGVVWKARHRFLDQTVAVKFLTPESWTDPQAVARFYREMRAVGRVVHPNLVRAIDAGQYDGHHVLVMECLSGMTVRDLLAKVGPLAVADAAEIVRQASLAVAAIAAAGMTHRDLKPSNLFLTAEGTVKVMDLGLARFHRDPAEHDLTHSGNLLGTIDYMAPEQSEDPRAVDVRSDLYSLGCTLFALLTGRAPFSGSGYSSIESRLRAHRESSPPGLCEFRTQIPESLEGLVSTLLAKSPTQRLHSAEELARRLIPFAQDARLKSLYERSLQSLPPGEVRPTADVSGRPSSPSSRPITRSEVETSEISAAPVSPDAPTPREKPNAFIGTKVATGNHGRIWGLGVGIAGAALLAAAAIPTFWPWWPAAPTGMEFSPPLKVENPIPEGRDDRNDAPSVRLVDYSDSPPSQLYSALDHRPIPVYWKENEGVDFTKWDALKGEFVVSNQEQAVFALARLDQHDFSLEIHLHQIGWAGNVGVFLGLADWTIGQRTPGWSCHCFLVDQSEDDRGNRKHRLVFSRLTALPGVDQTIDLNFESEASEELLSLRGEAALDLTIKHGRIHRLVFAGQELDQMRQDINDVTPNVHWNGPLGVIVNYGAATFRRARLQRLESGSR